MFINLNNIKNIDKNNVIESEMSVNKLGKSKDEVIEFKDKAGKPNTVAAKSLDISIRSLGDIRGLEDTIKSV